jgi:putative ABC transport system substrate-binding protein
MMSFAPDREEILKRVAYYVDRLLRGTKPADLPFEEASKFKLTLNLKTRRRSAWRFRKQCCCGRMR